MPVQTESFEMFEIKLKFKYVSVIGQMSIMVMILMFVWQLTRQLRIVGVCRC